MASKRQHINWILDELPHLKGCGVISEESCGALTDYYKNELEALPSPLRIFSLILTVMGCVMAAAGIILFLNYNWDMFSKEVRIGIAAVPLFAGALLSFFTILKEKSQLWREGSAILTATGAAVLIAVLSQIYHSGGELHEFMFLVLLLSLPLIYIFNSIGLATLCVFLSFTVNGFLAPCWWNLLVCGLLLPFLLYHLREKSKYVVWCRYLAPVAAISAFCGSASSYYGPLPAVILCGIFLAAGTDLWKAGTPFGKNPWLIPAFILNTVLLAWGSSTESFFRITDFQRNFFPRSATPEMIISCFWIFTGVAAVIYLFVFQRRRLSVARALPLLLILVTAIPFLTREPVMRIVYNVCFGLFGIILLRNGYVRRSLLLFDAGAVTLGTLIVCRFFDADIGVLWRSGAFVLLGVGFIVANMIFLRKNGKEAVR